MLAYLDVLDERWPADEEAPITFVVIPEYVARSWWERILYNQSAKRLRTALLGRPHTVVVNVPYRREEPDPKEVAHGGGTTPGIKGTAEVAHPPDADGARPPTPPRRRPDGPKPPPEAPPSA
jgi:hypothetical protein